MVEVFEVVGKHATAAAQKLGKKISPDQRVFVCQQDEEIIGLGVLGLDKGVVVIKEIFTNKPFEYFDLLARSVLSVVMDFSPIKVRVECINPYFRRFGFDENYTALNTDLNLDGWCKTGCDGCSSNCKS